MRDALRSLPGVEQVTANSDTTTARLVVREEDFDPAAAREVLAWIGYEAAPLPAACEAASRSR